MKRYVIRISIAAAILGSIAVVNIYRHVDDAYAQWGAAEMVIAYMRDHHGEWPTDWNSLRQYFEDVNGRVPGWSFEKLQTRVSIDFSAEPNLLRQHAAESETVPFEVIRAASVWGSQFEDGPNDILYRYFRSENSLGR